LHCITNDNKNYFKMAELHKKHNHAFFWIEAEQLFETYTTLRGNRYCFVKDVPGMVDNDKLSQKDIDFIEEKY
jgi:hypothetical protein